MSNRGVLTEQDISLITERDLEEQATTLMAKNNGPVFVLQAVTDFDRAATLLYAAKRNNRLFLQDLYAAHIAVAADQAMPNPVSWVGVKAYLTTGYKPEHPRYKKNGLMLNALSDESASSPEVQACLALADKLGLKMITLRVSGHANALALKTLIEAVKPTKLIPLVSQNAAWFAAEHPEIAVLTQDNIEC